MKRTGTLNAVAEYVEIDIGPEDGNVVAQITGTWVGTLKPQVQAETDGPWVDARWLDTDGAAAAETATANGNFQFLRVAGAQKARVYMSAYTSGDAVVALRGARGMGVIEPGATGGATEASVDGLEALLTSLLAAARYTPFDQAADGTGRQVGSGAATLGPCVASNINAEDCWILFKDAASYTGTTVFRLFVPAGDATRRGAAEITIPLIFTTGCWYKAVKTSDGSTAPSVALEFSGGWR